MSYLKLFIVTFIVAFAKGCELNQDEFRRVGMECAAAHPEFMMDVASHMGDPEDMEHPYFLCNHQKALVSIVECLKDKLVKCVPEEYSAMLPTVMELFPTKERLADGFKYMCDHKKHFQDKCLQDSVMDIYTCYMGKVAQLQPQAATSHDIKGLFCKVIRSEEQCFRDNRGTCSKEYIEFLVGLIEKFFPTTGCSSYKAATHDNNALANTILGNILVHGQPQGPLKYSPIYNVVKN